MAFTALTAMERSLVDDASTTKSDADTTLATEDTYPLKHESDMMLVQQKSTNTAASSHSENLRVYTDDEDDEEAVNDDQSHYHMEDDHSNNDDNLSWDASKRPTLNGGSSINTGSTYEETPFLSQKYSASAVRAHQGQKNGDLNHLQAQQEQSSLQQPQNQSGYDQDNESFSWKATEFTNAPSAADEPGDSGYACEMIVETQNMLQQAKTKADDCLKNMFPHPVSNTEKVSINDESSSSSGICASLQHVVSACGDGIDGILVKLFHVSENADARNQPPSKYAVSVNESLTNNLKHVLHAAVRSEPTASRSKSKKKKTRKVSQLHDDVSLPSASPEVFLVPLATSADESTGGDLRDMQHDDHEEHSDIRDDLDDVLGETCYGEFGGGQDPLSKYRETYDSDSVDKRESTSTASSINSDIGREKTEMGRDGLCDSASVARMLEKYSERKGALDERRAKLVAMSRDDDVAASDLSLFSLHQKHVQQLLQKTGPSQFDKSDHSNVTADDDSSGNVRVSSLYGRHVVNLINKNLDATNRSKSINFSHVDVGDDDELLDTETQKSFPAGRSWHSKVRTEKELEKSTEIDFEVDTAAEPSWHSSSIVDEIDMTLHKRKEKLRKLMDDLSLTMNKAVNGKLQLEKSQYIIDAEAERGIDTEDQTNLVPVQAVDQPIDLTKGTIRNLFALFLRNMLASTTTRSPNMATAASKMALRATGASVSGTQNGEQRRTILGISKALDKRLYRMAKGVMPNISQTEQVALGCGTIGFDRDIFTGSPSLKHLVDTYKPKLTAEEQSFLDNETNKLCELLNDHDVSMAKDFNKEVWDYMRDQGFFALKIPKEWGGKGFSTHAVSQILVKLSTQSFDANATVAVPNSLGPGELLARYGTDEQKEYFLPRLADGTLIPCFGLTGPHSGSDATSLIQSDCVVEERNGELGVVASFKKRYITLAPVAGVVGLGLNLSDPKGLLKGVGAEGFSVALLERDHPGLRMGRRHMPLNAAFMNGTVEGDDVWIPMSNILGGQERCGFGWHMFVECLAEGRGVSLPAGSAGCGRGVVSAVGAYTRVRKQFRVPIAEFGGIQEALSLAGSDALITIAGTDLMNAIIDNHEAPMVVSSIMKQNCTERGRRIVERGMDIAAGSAICRGDKNYLGNAYMSLPIAITVEGANIMTRSFQIIGQGLTRCHPHMLELIYSLQAPKEKEDEAIKTFTNQFYKVVNHGLTNFFHSITRGVGSTVSTKFRSSKAYKDGDKLLDYHEKQLLRLSANFALTADLCFTLGGRLKFEELLMGRLADAMGAIFLGYSTLHHYSRNRGVDGLEAITEHAMLRLEKEALDALKEASDNFPGPLGTVASTIMKMGCFPLGSITRPYSPPTDSLTKEVSHLLTNPSGLRDMFQENIYVAPEGVAHQVSDLIRALPVCVEADKIASTLRREKREPTLEEADKIAKAEAMRDILIQVNAFDHLTDAEGQEGYVRPALLGTEERLAALERKRFA